MRTSEAARYARWSAIAAGVIAAVTLSVFLHRAWQARQERKKAPAPAPPSVERLSSALAFSKVVKDQTIFTVRASRSTEFKASGQNLLEDVQVTVFGRGGKRHDTLHTQRCEYEKDSGRITCAGEVQIDLESAKDAARPDAGARRAHVETRRVTFDRNSGVARTDEKVTFAFPNCQGQALGASYRSDDGVLRLEKDVKLWLKPSGSAGTSEERQVEVTGSSLEYRRNTQRLQLGGPVRAVMETTELNAGEMALELDASFRAHRLVALGGQGGSRPQVRSGQPKGETQITADQVMAQFHPEGWLQDLAAAGGVEGQFRGERESEDFHADKAQASFWPRSEQLREIEATGNVALEGSRRGGLRRKLETNALRVAFSKPANGRENRVESAETLAPGAVEWTEVGEKGVRVVTRLSGDVLSAQFGATGRAEKVDVKRNVRVERHIEGQPNETATAQSGTAKFSSDGNWAQVDLKGDVRLDEAPLGQGANGRSARADAAAFVRATQSAALTGNAVVSDEATRTTARRITFEQTTGGIRADGAVRTTEFEAGRSGVSLVPQTANVSADRLEANSRTGRAVYAGHARLWQGNAAIEADAIELLRPTRQLNARGNVRAEFAQTAASRQTATQPQPGTTWRVRAGTLTYRDLEGKMHLEKDVRAQSAEGVIQAAAVDLYFTQAAGREQQVTRAVATGGVEVRQGDRRATAERGEYTAAEGKFVLSGGNPTIFDAFRGTTTGRQLTFYSADDTIIVDSEQGSRTLTKHRVEK